MKPRFAVFKTNRNKLNDAGKEQYHVRLSSHQTLSTAEILRDLENESGLKESVIIPCVLALSEYLVRKVGEGYTIKIDSLGCFSAKMAARQPISNPDTLLNSHVKIQNILFSPTRQHLLRLRNTPCERDWEEGNCTLTPELRQERILTHLLNKMGMNGDRETMISRKEVMQLNHCGQNTAARDLDELVGSGELKSIDLGNRLYYKMAATSL